MRKVTFSLLTILVVAVLVFLANETIIHYRLMMERLDRIEHAIDAGASGVHERREE